MMLNLGFARLEDLSGFNIKNIVSLIGDIDSIRVNLIFGHLYKYPFYLRLAVDYNPFGNHFSDAIIPLRNVTRVRRYKDKGPLGEIGGSYGDSHYQLQGSISYLFGGLGLLKGQYDHMRSIEIPYFPVIESTLMGRSVGVSKEMEIMFNLYSHINFSKSCNFLFEYVYNARAFLFTDWRKQALAHALHVEGSKHFPSMTLIRWDTSPAVIGGFECGAKLLQESPVTVSNLFITGKLEFWKKRLTLLGGTRVDLTHGLQPFGRISLSL